MRRLKKLFTRAARSIGMLGAYHFFLAWIGSVLNRHPSRKMKVIGVTGTKGKSTVIEMLNAILREAGERVLVSSSIKFQIGDDVRSNTTGNTMPGRGFLQKLMREGVSAGCTYAILEVVSEGVVQHRHRFIDFDAAVFTNIHPEHIESHGSYEKYRSAKEKFFRDVSRFSRKPDKKFFVNQNDPEGDFFVRAASDEAVVLYGISKAHIKIAGEFNKENAGAAEAIARAFGVSDAAITRALENFHGIPGRMEIVAESPIRVVVDYAHTPNSLEAVYSALSGDNRSGSSLVCVFGATGGGRDKWKRPRFGEIAARYCKYIILTDEDPFDDDPAQIISEIKAGIPRDKTEDVYEILDRGEAITKGISLAEAGDTVLITGKGSEPYIRVANGKRIPWSDKEKAQKALFLAKQGNNEIMGQ